MSENTGILVSTLPLHRAHALLVKKDWKGIVNEDKAFCAAVKISFTYDSKDFTVL